MNMKEKRTVQMKKSVVGRMMILEGVILLVPLLILPFYAGELSLAWIFVVPAAGSVALGLVVCYLRLQIISSCRVVVFAWLYGMLLGAIPFLLYGGVTPLQALFEAVSGFTTTGLSVLEVEQLPHLFLLYRAFLQYVGGLGFVVTMLVFVQEKESAVLYRAEGHPELLMPGIGKTARVIVVMYVFFLMIGTGLYVACGMSPLDSLVHTMCALSTGGFSNHTDSIGYYNSWAIEGITVLLMLVGTTNFTFLLLLFKGKLKEFAKASELRFLCGLILLAVPVLVGCLMTGGRTAAGGLRLAVFNAISALSTTGYATCGYQDWPESAIAVMIILMVIGGGLGSTAGGIKLARVCILCKDLWRNVRKKISPDRKVLLTYYHRGMDREVLEPDRIEEARTYAGCYLLVYLVGTLMLTICSGCTLLQGAFEFASSLGTVGLSIGITGAQTNEACLLIEMGGMILGRLEIFVLLKALCRH